MIVTAAVVLLGVGVGVGSRVPSAGIAFAAAISVLLAVAAARRATLLAAAPLGLALGVPWPLPGLAVTLLLHRRGIAMPRVISRNRIRAAILVGTACLVTVPLALLVAGGQLQLNRLVLDVEQPPLIVVAGVVLLAAVVNSTTEELLWRRHLLDLLVASGAGRATAVTVQAASFGLAHAGGLPGGVTGALAAAAFGALLGVLRCASPGLTGCVVVHLAVDVALFGAFAAHVVYVPA